MCGDVTSLIWPICIGYFYVPGSVIGTRDEFQLAGVLAVPLSGGCFLLCGGAVVCVYCLFPKGSCAGSLVPSLTVVRGGRSLQGGA